MAGFPDIPEAPSPTEVELDRASGLTLTWPDGTTDRFDLEELRFNCPCAACRGRREQGLDAWPTPGAPEPLQMPLQTMLTATAQQRITRAASHEDSGAKQLATYFVGQGVGLMDRVRPAREVVADMVREYLAVAARFAKHFSD